MLCTKKAHECTIFQTFECSNYERSEGTSSVVFEVNGFYEFVHLQLFDDVKLLFSEIFVIFRKEKRTAVYKSTSLVLDFKLTRENDNLFSLRYKWISEVPHPVHEYTKMQILNRRHLTNPARTFWGTWSTSALRYLGLDHFGRPRTNTCRIQVKLWSKKF